MNFIKKNLVLSAIIAVLIIGGGVALVNQTSRQNINNQTKQATSSAEKKTLATLTVKADGKESKYNLTSGVGSSALDLSQTATGNKVITTGTGVNAFVTSINGRAASSDKKEFWKLVINGKDSQVGAGSYMVKEGDNIVWEIATY